MFSQYNPEIHHRRSIRLSGYDYSQPGIYFVTLSIKDRNNYFGEIIQDVGASHGTPVQKLSLIGKIVEVKWNKIPEVYKMVKLDEFVIMPNHFHGIIIINPSIGNNQGAPWRAGAFGGLIKNSLSSIINHFKGAVKKECNHCGFEYFEWQRDYYEHIIRDDNELNRIREYIENNPKNWERDRNNIKNVL